MSKAAADLAKERKQQAKSAAAIESAFPSILLAGFLGFTVASIGAFFVRKKMS